MKMEGVKFWGSVVVVTHREFEIFGCVGWGGAEAPLVAGNWAAEGVGLGG